MTGVFLSHLNRGNGGSSSNSQRILDFDRQTLSPASRILRILVLRTTFTLALTVSAELLRSCARCETYAACAWWYRTYRSIALFNDGFTLRSALRGSIPMNHCFHVRAFISAFGVVSSPSALISSPILSLSSIFEGLAARPTFSGSSYDGG